MLVIISKFCTRITVVGYDMGYDIPKNRTKILFINHAWLSKDFSMRYNLNFACEWRFDVYHATFWCVKTDVLIVYVYLPYFPLIFIQDVAG